MVIGYSKAVTWVWLALLLITLSNWFLGATPELGMTPIQRITLLGLMAVKLALVLSHFMQVQHAHRVFVWLAGSWVLAVALVLLWIYP